MRLARREPWSELENLFDNQPAQTGSFGWDLAVDVNEEKDKGAAKMQLPGVDSEKEDVSFEDGQRLRVVGTREEKHETKIIS
jgi:HSP20 family molecular chaperone IbpA